LCIGVWQSRPSESARFHFWRSCYAEIGITVPFPFQTNTLSLLLHTLDLFCPAGDVLKWFLCPAPLSLRFVYVTSRSRKFYGEYLKILGNGLQHLVLHLYSGPSGETAKVRISSNLITLAMTLSPCIFWRYIDLSHNENCALFTSTSPGVMKFAIAIFSQIHSPRSEDFIPIYDSYLGEELDRAAT